jgi:hypothetical protein
VDGKAHFPVATYLAARLHHQNEQSIWREFHFILQHYFNLLLEKARN